MKDLLFLGLLLVVAQACTAQPANRSYAEGVQNVEDYIKANDLGQWERATFAGGCFWCTEASFERIKGVVDVVSGYSGGKKTYPTYKEVSYGKTAHAESIQIFYDPEVITYAQLLEVFFVAHDPTTLNRQGPDVGPQYRSAIFYHDEGQKLQAEQYIDKLTDERTFDDPIVTELSPYQAFWMAEGYHQDYYEHNPGNMYVLRVSRPKVEKVKKTFKAWLKEEYK